MQISVRSCRSEKDKYMEMVYLAITRKGLRKVLSTAVETGAIV